MLRQLHGLTGSALDHGSLPPDFKSRHDFESEGCFILASLPLEVAQPI